MTVALLLVTLMVLIMQQRSVQATKAGLPNLVFLLADDFGHYSVGYNNPDILTPHINNLATNGITLLEHYTYMFCSPTRTSLLTGRWPFKAAGVRNNLNPSEIGKPMLVNI